MRTPILAVFALSLVSAPAFAFTVTVKGHIGKGAIIYRTTDGATACHDEMSTIHDIGPICARHIVAIVENGTKLSRTSGTGFLSSYDNVTVLTGKAAGKTGVIGTDDLDKAEIEDMLKKPTAARKASP